MSAMKKGTKLTDKPKGFMLRVRLDDETLFKLDKMCELLNMTKSQVVRKGIEEQYQKKKK